MLIGITGHAQNGKDSTGQRLVEEFGFTRYAFADQLKALALDMDPIVLLKVRMLNGEQAGSDSLRLSELVGEVGWEGAKSIPEVRRILIMLGIGVRNRIGADAWVDAVLNRIEADGLDYMVDRIVITDVRFPNEANWIQGEGYLMRVKRTGFEPVVDVTNESEKYVDEFIVQEQLDIEAANLEELYPKVDTAMLFVISRLQPLASTELMRAYD